jgi:hypothetical protein
MQPFLQKFNSFPMAPEIEQSLPSSPVPWLAMPVA